MEILKKAKELYFNKEYTKALGLFIQIVNNEQAEIMYYIGSCYEKGFHEEYCEYAMEWYTKSANLGYLEAQYSLSCCYDIGYSLFIKPNENEYLKWAKKAAENGHAKACSLLGFHYHEEEDLKEVSYWFNKGVEKNDDFSFYMLSSYMLKEKKYYEAIDLLFKAIQFCNEDCYIKIYYSEIAKIYESELNDYIKAIKYYKLSFENGYYKLGNFYEKGIGVAKDIKQAVIYYKKAFDTKKELIFFENNCCRRLIKLCKGEKDYNTNALKWLITINDIQSNYILEECYLNRYDINPEYNKFFDIWEKAKSGDINSKIEFGYYNLKIFNKISWESDWHNWYKELAYLNNGDVLFLSSIYCCDNNIDRFNLCEKAAKSGNTEAMIQLSKYYFEGDIINKSNEYSLYWLNKASKSNYKVLLILGYIYAHGLLSQVDYKNAYEYYKKASKLKKENENFYFDWNVFSGYKKIIDDANSGDLYANLYLSIAYDNGFELMKNKKEASRYYNKAKKIKGITINKK